SQLVRNLNTILTAEGVTEGKNPTMHDALEDAFENGYDITKISPTSEGNDIVWDSKSDRFALVEAATGNAVFSDSETTLSTGVDLWKIYDEMPDTQSYSIYAGKNWTATEVGTETNPLTVGFDAGDASGITAVSYVGIGLAQTVAIRTNSHDTVLTINAPLDIVNHYDEANRIEIISVAPTSYHEFGNILGSINLTSGRVVTEKSASAASVTIKASADAITNGTATIGVDNTCAPEISIIVPSDVKQVIENSENDKNNIVASEGSLAVVADNTVAIIGATAYDSFMGAWTDAQTNDTITLLNDASFSDRITHNDGRKITIDLNGYQLSNLNSGKGFYLKDKSELIMKNGQLSLNKFADVTNPAIQIDTQSSITLDHVKYDTDGSALYPRGDAAKVEVLDSTVRARGYAVGTNAETVDNYYVNIQLKNSTLESLQEGCETAVLVNVPGTLNIDNCHLIGYYQGLIVRGGTAVVKDTVIDNTITEAYQSNSAYNYDNKAWGSGNCVPMSVLVVGNRSTSYQYATQVTLIRCTLRSLKEDGTYWSGEPTGWNTITDKSDTAPAIYVYANQGAGLGVTLTIDADTKIYGQKIQGTENNIAINEE
ncbi:MAG: hypothetical protein ACI4U2_02140, partial [Christensenellaceae bacterium]